MATSVRPALTPHEHPSEAAGAAGRDFGPRSGPLNQEKLLETGRCGLVDDVLREACRDP